MFVTKFIARQPIFNRRKNVYGYELLFRNSAENSCGDIDDDTASLNLIRDSLLLHGLENLTEDRKAFINFPRGLLVQNHASLLPKNRVVIEILESVAPDAEVLQACRVLKEMGYRLALDDVQSAGRIADFPDLIDIVKVDLPSTSPELWKNLIQQFSRTKLRFLAEKVETNEDFHLLREYGYHFFQGYFFSKPEVLRTKELPPLTLSYLRILQTVHQPEINLSEAENIIKSEPSLCFKLLRYLNSALFGFRNGISSIRHAITILGENEFRRWISLLVLGGMCQSKPQELIVTSLIRASFCEALGKKVGVGDNDGDCFLMGLFSLIDAILDRPLQEVLTSVPLHDGIKAALLDNNTPMGKILQMVQNYESGDWTQLSAAATKHGIDENRISNMYLNAVSWTGKVLRSTS